MKVAQLLQGDVLNAPSAMSVDCTNSKSNAELPLRVPGKLYESNFRDVEAHPSARRIARADFGTSW